MEREHRTTGRRRTIWLRIHPFEWLAVAQLAAVSLLLAARGVRTDMAQALAFAGQTAMFYAGVVVAGRLLLFAAERWRLLRSAQALTRWRWGARDWRVVSAWWVLTARIVAATIVIIHSYGWLKVSVPLLHPILLDGTFDHLDRLLHGGISPAIVAAELASSARLLGPIDVAYGLFLPALTVGTGILLGARQRRWRQAVTFSYALLWSVTAWLYLALPAAGPCYAYPAEWSRHARQMPMATAAQEALLVNYRRVQRSGGDLTRGIRFNLGIAAFPSLHVGALALVWFWMRRKFRLGRHLWLLIVAVTLVGSLATGWHYAVDGYAGLLLAWLAHQLAWKMYRGRERAAPA